VRIHRQCSFSSSKERVTVSWALGDKLSTDDFISACLVHDYDRLSPSLVELIRQRSRQVVYRPTRRVRHDNSDRLGRERLRRGKQAESSKSDSGDSDLGEGFHNFDT